MSLIITTGDFSNLNLAFQNGVKEKDNYFLNLIHLVGDNYDKKEKNWFHKIFLLNK